LQAYKLGEARLSLLQSFLNTNYRIDVPGVGSERAQRYVLRISRTGYAEDMIRSELFWLTALRRDTNLSVPEPVPNRSSDLVTTVDVEGVPGPRHVVLVRWLLGRTFRKGLTPDMLESVGELSARLHVHGQGLKLPSWFTRPRWDLPGLKGGVIGTDPEKSLSVLAPSQRDVISRVADRVGQAMSELGEGPDAYGLIHADLQRGNWLFHGGGISLLDFEVCGWGHFAHDIGITFAVLRDHPQLPSMRQAFLEGYRRVRPLPREQEELIDVFMAGRIMGYTLWLAALMDNPMFAIIAKGIPARIDAQVTYLELFLKQ